MKKSVSVYLERTLTSTKLVFETEDGEVLELPVVENATGAREECLVFLRDKYPDDWQSFAGDLEAVGGQGVWGHFMDGPSPDPTKLNEEYRRWKHEKDRHTGMGGIPIRRRRETQQTAEKPFQGEEAKGS